MQRNTKFGVFGLCLFLFGIIFGWVLFPTLLKSQIHKQIRLKKGSPTREIWSKFPFYLEFRIYLFNITNADEISQGAKPKVQQVGPYFFEEWQEKVDIVDRESDDTAEYAVKNKFIFRPDLSEGLTGDEELIMPHVFILAMIMTAVRDKPTMIPVVNKAVNSIFKNPTSIFVKVKAMDIMFGGLPIDCTVTDFAGSAVCGMLRDNHEALQEDGPDHYRFSLFGAKNDTPSSTRVRVLRGIKKLKNVGIVVESGGKPNISVWNDEYCDTFNGTDGTIFHPWLYEDEDVVSFSPDICRSLSTRFQKKTSVAGLKTNRYTAFLGDSSTIPEEKCFCAAPDNCLKAGVYDLFKCAGVPLIVSHPHFYLGHTSYLESVDGLSPSQELHELYLDFEPFTGSPLSAKKRIQFNIFIHKVEKIKMMKTFPDALLPLFWIEEGVVMPDYLIKQVKMGHKTVKIVKYMKYIMMLIGLCLCGVSAYLTITGKKSSSEVTEIIENGKRSNGTDNGIAPMNVGGYVQQVPPMID